jgi:hypothetical protein
MTTSQTGAGGHLGLDELTAEAAHLSSGDRNELCRRIQGLDASELDYDDELDVAESLGNKNALA